MIKQINKTEANKHITLKIVKYKDMLKNEWKYCKCLKKILIELYKVQVCCICHLLRIVIVTGSSPWFILWEKKWKKKSWKRDNFLCFSFPLFLPVSFECVFDLKATAKGWFLLCVFVSVCDWLPCPAKWPLLGHWLMSLFYDLS